MKQIPQQIGGPNDALDVRKGAKVVRSREWLAANLKSRNGDTLQDLNTRKHQATGRKLIARDKLRDAEAALQPLRDELASAEWDEMNIQCRLNNWWNQCRGAYEAANEEAERP